MQLSAREANPTLKPFHVQYFYPDKDFSYTWKEHGGLSGHVDSQIRKDLRHKRLIKDQELLISPTLDAGRLSVLLDSYNNLNGAGVDVFYYMISGLWRCGGTYVMSELAKMNGLDVKKQHIAWNHEFMPRKAEVLADFHGELDIKAKYRDYCATLLASARHYDQPAFFRRAVVGPLMFSKMIDNFGNANSFRIRWYHIIRDINGAIASLEKLYPDIGHFLVDEVNCFRPNYRGSARIYPLAIVLWWMANTLVLPSLQGLPLWSELIDLESEPIKQLKSGVDTYLEENTLNQNGFRPILIKFGSETEKMMKKAGASPSKFNYSPKKEIDNQFTPLYKEMIKQLKRLYDHYGIEFDGRLERV